MASPARIVLLACGSFNPITNMHLRMFEIAKDYLQKSGKYLVIGGIISPVNDGYAKKGLLSCKHRVAMCNVATESSEWLRIDTWESEQDQWLETVRVLKHHQAVLDAKYISDSVNGNKTKRLEFQQQLSTIAKRTRRGRSVPQQQMQLQVGESNANFLPSASRPKRRKLHLDVDVQQNEVAENAIEHTPSSSRRTPDDGYFSQINSPEYERPVQLKLLCGADMLESFAVPGLWKDEDIEEIVGKFGIIVISRAGSNPQKFIYESDVLTRLENHIEIVTEWIPNEVSSTRIRRALRRGNSVKYLVPDPVINYIKSHGLYQQEEEKQ